MEREFNKLKKFAELSTTDSNPDLAIHSQFNYLNSQTSLTLNR